MERDVLGDNPWVTVLVAALDNELLGYAALVPLVQLQAGKRGMDMHHLYVAADHRKKGIGRALIEASIEEARRQHCEYVMVGTDPANGVAQDVYLAVGFDRAPAYGPRFGKRL